MTDVKTQDDVTARCLNYLVWSAMHGNTTTHDELLLNSGLPLTSNASPRRISEALVDIFKWTQDKGWPVLTSLVLRVGGQDVGLPTKKFWEMVDSHLDYRNFYCLGPMALAPKEVRKTYSKYLQQICFNYFQGLKGNNLTASSAIDGMQVSRFTPNPGSTNDVAERVLTTLEGFAYLPIEDMLRVLKYVFEEDGTVDVDCFDQIMQIANEHPGDWTPVLDMVKQPRTSNYNRGNASIVSQDR